MKTQCDIELSKKEEFVVYYKLNNNSELVEETMLLDISTSEELMKDKVRDNKVSSFYNASTTF